MNVLLLDTDDTGFDPFYYIKLLSPSAWRFIRYELHKNYTDIDIALVSGYGNIIAEDTLLNLHTKGIPTLYIHNEVVLSQPVPHCNYYSVGSVPQKTLLTKWGAPSDKIFVTGWSLLDFCKNSQVLDLPSREEFYRDRNIEDEYFLDIKKPITVSILSDQHYNKEVYRKFKDYKDDYSNINLIDVFLYEIPSGAELDITCLLSYIKNSDCIISDNLDVLIFSTLLNKQAVILFPEYSQAEDELYELHTKGELPAVRDKDDIYSFLKKLNTLPPIKPEFSEEGLNYYLMNYLPTTFDGNNTKRIVQVMDFIKQTTKLQNSYYSKLYGILGQKHTFLTDPLFKQKTDALLSLEGNTDV